MYSNCVCVASITTHKRPVSPLVAPIQVQLAKQFKEITLSRKLKARTPLPTLLETTAVLSPSDLHCASLVCPGIRSKIQFFEGLVSPR